jgi:hypothetical protein
MMENAYTNIASILPQCGDDGGGGGWRAYTDERWRWRSRRSMCVRGRAATTAEEAGSSGVDDGGGDQWSRNHVAGT